MVARVMRTHQKQKRTLLHNNLGFRDTVAYRLVRENKATIDVELCVLTVTDAYNGM